ncbi:MAG: hypothetical protein HC896_18595 [Bacteroidales bacterium]|nr:hypothetical protein [Bacteroidales bacterium]
MENHDQTNQANGAERNKAKSPALLIVLIVLLAGGIGVLAVLYFNLKEQAVTTEALLEDQKNTLTNQLNELYVGYDSLKTNNDSINLELLAQQNKIKRLLAINASNAEKIKVYQKELMTLREIMKSYILQIDSLNQKNQFLIAENQEVRQNLISVESSKMQLEEEKQYLSSQVEVASILAAKNIVAYPLNDRGKEKYKADKVSTIKTCFTVRENAIVKPGTKTVYIKITLNDAVLTHDFNNVIGINGENVVFSEKRDLEYANQDIEMCIFYEVKDPLQPGNYGVDIYTEGHLIGTTSFALK